MGQPITQSPANVGGWSENDLVDFVRRNIVNLLPEIAPSLGSNNVRVPGHVYLQPDSRIKQRGMDAPVVVSAASGPGFLNSYADGPAPNAKVQFYKDPFGWVHLHGSTVNGVGTVGSAMFQLPPGYRPDAQCVVMVPTDTNSQNFAQLIIGTDGTVTLGSGTRTSAYLTGVKFPTLSNV